jgi:gamma-glutamyltranspeptidase/glutathione hydrolase
MNAGPIAVTPHQLASNAAFTIMSRGGSAVDGAIAANAVLAVVLPTTCGPGGDLFALVHVPGTEVPVALNASGRSGSGADAESLRSVKFDDVPLQGPLSITIPGCIDGWEALLGRFGRFGFEKALKPAITLADEGFPVSPELAAGLARIRDLVADQPAARRLYPDGAAPKPGTTLRRPDLAGTLRTIAIGGRKAFYEGKVGTAITAATQGGITSEDLTANQASWVDPIGIHVFGRDAWTVPPNSQGYLTLAAAWLFEQMDVRADPVDPAYHHALIEAYRAVAWERDDLVADPATAPLEPELLLDPSRLVDRLERFSPDTAAHWPGPTSAPGGTAYLCFRDADGMSVSLIQSNFHGIGSGIGAGDTGVFLHNRGAGFSLRPGHPNELLPGKRPLHTLSPTLWTRNGEFAALLGTRGGNQQPQILLQMAAHMFAAGMSPAAAQGVPRWTIPAFGPDTDSRISVEGAFPTDVRFGLARRGHDVTVMESEAMPGWGPVSAIVAGEDGDHAAADPRVSTASVSSLEE